MDEIQKALNLAKSGEPAVLTFPEGQFVVLSWEKYCEMKRLYEIELVTTEQLDNRILELEDEIKEKDEVYLNYLNE